MLSTVLADTCRSFGRAVVMPNLVPPVTDVAAAEAYRERILAARPQGSDFEPLMTLYLTDATNADTVKAAVDSDYVHGIKLYPAHATTNSAHGVTNLEALDPTLDVMAQLGLPLLVHGEMLGPDIDVFDREAVFIERVLSPLVKRHPTLKVVLEHITTQQGVQWVLQGDERMAGTVTPHHLIIDRNDLFDGGLRPHHYCLPVAKRREHKQALRNAVCSGHPRLFLGTDSAPHTTEAKESACGCAGIYSAPTAVELYAQVFEEEGALEHLEAFASTNGPAFYGLPVNSARLQVRFDEITEAPAARKVPGQGEVLPFHPKAGLRCVAERL